MRSDGTPKIAIPGAAGQAIAAALARMATHPGEATLTIAKARILGGGYAYTVSNSEPPERPANNQR